MLQLNEYNYTEISAEVIFSLFSREISISVRKTLAVISRNSSQFSNVSDRGNTHINELTQHSF